MMLELLRASGKLREGAILVALTAFSVGLCLFRYWSSGQFIFFFFIWNLFLAGVPWVISSGLLLFPGLRRRAVPFWLLLGFWLLFFPNAPYILTDLLHLRERPSAPMWYDLLLILSFAWTGLVLGFYSLRDVESLLLARFRRVWIALGSGAIWFLGAFGVYLGRFSRWNSWDMLQHPGAIVEQVLAALADPQAHPRTWGFTVLLGILLNLAYWSFRPRTEKLPADA